MFSLPLRGLDELGTSHFFMREDFKWAVFLPRRVNSQSEPDIRTILCCLSVITGEQLLLLCVLTCCFLSPGDHIQAKILGNAPHGIYKYKFPRAIRTEDNVGAKVFFYKAFLQSSDLSRAELKKDYLWVTKDELGAYLKPEYLKKVNRFLLDL